MPQFVTDRAASFLSRRGTLLSAGAAGTGGVALGVHRSHKDGNQDPTLAVAAGTGLVAGGIGAGLYAGRKTLWPTTKFAGKAAYGISKNLAVGTSRIAKAAWKAPGPVKALGFVAAAVGVGVGARAFAHEEPAQEDHLADDGMGGYEAAPGLRDRARAMNATGDLVFGLNARRH